MSEASVWAECASRPSTEAEQRIQVLAEKDGQPELKLFESDDDDVE